MFEWVYAARCCVPEVKKRLFTVFLPGAVWGHGQAENQWDLFFLFPFLKLEHPSLSGCC